MSRLVLYHVLYDSRPSVPFAIAQTLDLDDPRVYRDLSRPVGALGDGRAAKFTERYEGLEMEYDPATAEALWAPNIHTSYEHLPSHAHSR